jgi:urease accessory protein
MLHAFKSLPIARALYRADALPSAADGYTSDTVTLGWEERLRARGRRRSDSGIEFGTALARGTILRAGDCFVLDQISTVVRVIERPEAVFVIEPKTPSQWALFGYQIGNCHQPLMVTDVAIVCADVPGMQEALEYHSIPFARCIQPFTPVVDIAAHTHQP